jgi:Tol biopolymer transport system component
MPALSRCCVLLASAALCAAPTASAHDLAFVSERDGNAEIHAIAADGTGERNLTNDPAADEAPAWSPDGASIAFVRGFADEADVWVMAADGSAQRRLTSEAGPDRSPDWSPDGRRIVFVSHRSGAADLHVMQADGTGVTRITGSGTAAAPAWSPDGSRIAYWREDTSRVHVVGADGSGDRAVGGGDQPDVDPAWAPDGTRLAFATLRDPRTDLDVFSMGADGSAPAPLATSPGRDIEPAWAADGRIAFASDRDGGFDIWTMAADGSGQRKLTSAPGDDVTPDWRPVTPSFTGTLPEAGGSITVGPVPPPPGVRRSPATRAAGGTVRLTMRRSSVVVRGRRLVVTLRFELSAPASGTFRVHHRGRVVVSRLHRGRRGANRVTLTRRIGARSRWTGTYRLSVVNLRRRG